MQTLGPLFSTAVTRSERARRRRLLHIILLGITAAGVITLLALMVLAPAAVGSEHERRLLRFTAVGVIAGGSVIYGLSLYVSTELASATFVLALLAAATLSDVPDQVANGRGLLVFALPIVGASVLVRPWASFAAAGMSSIIVIVLGTAVLGDPVPNLPAVAAFFLLALLSWLSSRSLERTLDKLRETNRLLRRSEERYRLRFENVSDVLYTIDRQLRVTDISPSVKRILGYDPEELVGRSIQELDVIAPESMEQAMEDTLHIFEGDRISSTVYKFIAQDGTPRWGEASGAPLIRDGEVKAVISVARDVTERRRMERELKQQERLAAVGQLAGGIAHDFNNILASITLYAQMPLGRTALPPLAEKALKTILEESHRAADLVQQILDFSRSAMMETEYVSLVALVDRALELLRRTIPESIRLKAEATSDPCMIRADTTRIHQALTNLALNAKDAMPKGGELRISVEPITVEPDAQPPLPEMLPGRWARMEVSDTGTGMTSEVTEHLFEPFYTTKEPGKGTGLGLAQVYGIVKQHEGFIDVETAEGQGSTFTIFLPLVDEGVDREEQEREAPPVQGQGETILVVEDADQLREGIQAGLQSLGYRVVAAGNGVQALDAVVRQDVDLVITDVVMPEMGGEDLLRHLRDGNPELKIIAMTGHVMDTDVRSLRSIGFSAALRKPFSIQTLTQTVRTVLGE